MSPISKDLVIAIGQTSEDASSTVGVDTIGTLSCTLREYDDVKESPYIKHSAHTPTHRQEEI